MVEQATFTIFQCAFGCLLSISACLRDLDCKGLCRISMAVLTFRPSHETLQHWLRSSEVNFWNRHYVDYVVKVPSLNLRFETSSRLAELTSHKVVTFPSSTTGFLIKYFDQIMQSWNFVRDGHLILPWDVYRTLYRETSTEEHVVPKTLFHTFTNARL